MRGIAYLSLFFFFLKGQKGYLVLSEILVDGRISRSSKMGIFIEDVTNVIETQCVHHGKGSSVQKLVFSKVQKECAVSGIERGSKQLFILTSISMVN